MIAPRVLVAVTMLACPLLAPMRAESADSTSLTLKGTATLTTFDVNSGMDERANGGAHTQKVKCSSASAGPGLMLSTTASGRYLGLDGCLSACVDYVAFLGREGQLRSDDGTYIAYKDGVAFMGVAEGQPTSQGYVTGSLQGIGTGFPAVRSERGTVAFTHRIVFGTEEYLCSFAGTYKAKFAP